MRYEVQFKPRALKDLQRLPHSDARRAIERIEQMQEDLAGDVKRLTDHTHEFRLRVGDYRVLFELEGARAVIYRVLHRREAYER